MTVARMVGGKTHEQTAINHSGADLATYASTGIQGANLENNLFSGVTSLTKPAQALFTNSALPAAYKEVEEMIFGPGVIIGGGSDGITKLSIDNGTALTDIDLTGSSIKADLGAAGNSISFRGADLSGVDFHNSNLRASNFSGATVNATTDLSDLTITADAQDKLVGINLVGTFGQGKLPTGNETANQHNYVQTGTELVGTIKA